MASRERVCDTRERGRQCRRCFRRGLRRRCSDGWQSCIVRGSGSRHVGPRGRECSWAFSLACTGGGSCDVRLQERGKRSRGGSQLLTPRTPLPTQAALQQLLDALDPHLPSLNTYELVVLLAAAARLRAAPSPAWLSRFFAACTPRLRECGTGNLSMLARAVSGLALEPWVVKDVPGAWFKAWQRDFRCVGREG